jgi:hypothetical protein
MGGKRKGYQFARAAAYAVAGGQLFKLYEFERIRARYLGRREGYVMMWFGRDSGWGMRDVGLAVRGEAPESSAEHHKRRAKPNLEPTLAVRSHQG